PRVLDAQRTARREHTERGIAWVLEHLGSATQPHVDVARIGVPLTLLAGERDGRFAELARDTAARAPNVRAVLAPDVGHNALLEAPAVVASEIARLEGLVGTPEPKRDPVIPERVEGAPFGRGVAADFNQGTSS
ncbi:MAG: alpha/beta hydrolase, partial [Polyangiaceae bacterium]